MQTPLCNSPPQNYTILCFTGWVCQGPAHLWPCSESLQIQLPWGPPNSVHCGSEQTTGSTYTLSTLLTHHHKSLDLSVLHPFLSLPFCICVCLCSSNLLWRSACSYHNSQQILLIKSRVWFGVMHRYMLANKLCFKAFCIFMSTAKLCHRKRDIYLCHYLKLFHNRRGGSLIICCKPLFPAQNEKDEKLEIQTVFISI